MANDLPPLRLGNSSEGFCQPDELDRADPKRPRSAIAGISGRFYPGESESRNSAKSRELSGKTTAITWLCYKLSKVGTDSSAVNRVSGDIMGPLAKCQITAPGKDSLTAIENIENGKSHKGKFERSPEYTRTLEFCQLRCPARALEFSCNADLRQFPIAKECERSNTDACQGTSELAVVDTESQHGVSTARRTSNFFPHDGLCQGRLGRAAQQRDLMWQLVSPGKRRSQQYLGDVGNFASYSGKRSPDDRYELINSERQPNCSFLLAQRRRHTVTAPLKPNIRSLRRNRSLSDTYVGISPPRSIQLRSRSAFKEICPDRMAFASLCNRENFSAFRSSRNRSFCVTNCSRGTQVCESGFRSGGCFPQCLRSPLALQVSMGIPTTLSNTQSISAPEPGNRHVPGDNTRLEEGLLESRSGVSLHAPSLPGEGSGPSLDRHNNQSTSSTSSPIEFKGVVNTGWSSLLDSWQKDQVDILESSWRKSTLNTYKPAWLRWCRWSRENHVRTIDPSPEDVARFLTDLHLKFKFSYSTIAVHKSVVCTFCRPPSGFSLGSHIIIKQVLKGIALKQPPKAKSPIWDINVLIRYLVDKSPSKMSLFEISKRTAILLLLCSGRRVHDLTLLSINKENFVRSNDSIVFWPIFGSKTDNITYKQSGWCLLKCESNSNIDPIYWIDKLLEYSNGRRGNIESLFISTRGEPKPATRTIIGGWIKSLLKQAGINTSPGSVRSAVASASWSDNIPIDHILERGNWRSALTFHKYYKKEIKGYRSSNESSHLNRISNLFQTIR